MRFNSVVKGRSRLLAAMAMLCAIGVTSLIDPSVASAAGASVTPAQFRRALLASCSTAQALTNKQQAADCTWVRSGRNSSGKIYPYDSLNFDTSQLNPVASDVVNAQNRKVAGSVMFNCSPSDTQEWYTETTETSYTDTVSQEIGITAGVSGQGGSPSLSVSYKLAFSHSQTSGTSIAETAAPFIGPWSYADIYFQDYQYLDHGYIRIHFNSPVGNPSSATDTGAHYYHYVPADATAPRQDSAGKWGAFHVFTHTMNPQQIKDNCPGVALPMQNLVNEYATENSASTNDPGSWCLTNLGSMNAKTYPCSHVPNSATSLEQQSYLMSIGASTSTSAPVYLIGDFKNGMCLTTAKAGGLHGPVTAEACDITSPFQQWVQNFVPIPRPTIGINNVAYTLSNTATAACLTSWASGPNAQGYGINLENCTPDYPQQTWAATSTYWPIKPRVAVTPTPTATPVPNRQVSVAATNSVTSKSYVLAGSKFAAGTATVRVQSNTATLASQTVTVLANGTFSSSWTTGMAVGGATTLPVGSTKLVVTQADYMYVYLLS